jgi:hypothetical protein
MGLQLLGGTPARGTPGHLQSSVCRLQAPAATGVHNACFQQVQDDTSKARSLNRDWEFVLKGTEISLGKFVTEYFKHSHLIQTVVVSTEDTDKIPMGDGEGGSDQKGQGKGKEVSKGRLTHDRRGGGRKVLLAQ